MFAFRKVQGAVRYSLSKTIKLQIVPATPEWQNEKFKSIQPNLDLFDQPPARSQVNPAIAMGTPGRVV